MESVLSITCFLVNHFRARIELARRPELSECPGLLVDRSGGRAMVVDTLPAVREASAGMALERARALEPEAVVLEADEPHYRGEFERMLSALEAVSDRIEQAELGVAYVGLDGLAAMYGGEAQLLDALLHAVPEHFKPRIGVAAGKFPAFVAARVRRASGVTKLPECAAAWLAPHPTQLLPGPVELLDDLRRLGLRTLGDVAAQEVRSLLDRFGHEGRRVWELSRGIDERPLVPRTHEESITETLSLPDVTVSLELWRAAVDRLLERVYVRPQMQGRYAGTATLTCALEAAPAAAATWERAYHFKTGVGDWRRAAEIINGRLETEHPPAPIEAMTITLGNLNGATGSQLSLFPDLPHARERRLLETERQLQARLHCKQALHRLVDIAPWHPAPEMRVMQAPLDPAANDELRVLNAPAAVEVREGMDQHPLAVRLDRQWRRVARIEDQWSFDLWWRPTPIQRNYYRISQADGRQLTVFRDQREGCWYRQDASA